MMRPRRISMRWIDASGLLAVALLAAAPLQHAAPAAAPQHAAPAVTPDTALAELKAGNDHHVSKQYRRPHQTAERQRELASGQHPHAAILSCADSRVAPE